MSEACPERVGEIGALALGRLGAAEEADLRVHAAGCAACASEIRALEGTAAMLSLADPDRVEAPAPLPSAGELDRLTSRLDAERRSVRRRRGALAGTALAAAAGIAAVVVLAGGGADPAQQVKFDTGDPEVGLTATLADRQFGTEVEIYVRGIAEGTRCRVWLRDATGAREPAGSFVYRYGHDAGDATLVAAMEREAVDAVEIRAGSRRFVSPVGSGTGESIE